MKTGQSPTRRADELVKVMTLDQKISMLHQKLGDAVGSYGAAGYVADIPSLCIPALVLSDAGSGLADEQTDATAYPAAIAQAAAWDPTIAHRLGASLGGEAFDKGVNVLLGPDVNIARVPLNGRTSEAFGEDPYLAGQTAAAYIKGVQSRHVIATVKHYEANNQETDRGTINEQIGARTLAEIYQPAFRAAVRQGHVGAAMCSYNRVNGPYACQNRILLRRDLNHRMGFHGFVMSDWGATHSTVPSALHGLDLEMSIGQEPDPVSGGGAYGGGGTEVFEDYYGGPLKAAVQAGKVPMPVLDDMVHRILRSMFAIGLFDHPAPAEPSGYPADVDTPANQRTALQAAEAGTVLLKNHAGVLPLSGKDSTIALIGLDAGAGAEAVDQAGGSVHVVQPAITTPLTAIGARAARAGDTVAYNDGTDIQAAATLAKQSSVAVVYAGYAESEGSDRTSLGYDNGVCELTCVSQPANSDALIAAVAKANPRTVVVLNTGGPAAMPWLHQVAGVVEAWYPGEADGDAAAAVLFGDVNPSGKLPITFPRSLEQLPTRAARQYPGVNGKAYYSEGLLVGYRWYDARRLRPLFPFGFGLSYTRFRLSDLQLQRSGAAELVRYRLTNVGSRAGSDVTQVYVRDPKAAGEPPQQLKGYRRVSLRPGQSRTVTVRLAASAFEQWDPRTSAWHTAAGRYGIRVGDSSRHEPLHAGLRR
jgi:beta-glucosidase